MWGITDMNDCVAAANYLVKDGRVDARQLCIRGGSAGGKSTGVDDDVLLVVNVPAREKRESPRSRVNLHCQIGEQLEQGDALR